MKYIGKTMQGNGALVELESEELQAMTRLSAELKCVKDSIGGKAEDEFWIKMDTDFFVFLRQLADMIRAERQSHGANMPESVMCAIRGKAHEEQKTE